MPNAPTFLITIDTEGDDLWSRPRQATTHNARFLQRFQQLAERYGLKPTWLVDHDMAHCETFISMGRDVLKRGTGEIGLHPHAWNTPPLAPLSIEDHLRQPFMTSFSEDLIREKVDRLVSRLESVFDTPITSHRGGRWALDERYARVLVNRGIQVDCTVTPGLAWLAPDGTGCDYRDAPRGPYLAHPLNPARPGDSALLELPMTIRPTGPSRTRTLLQALGPMGRRAARRLTPEADWLRPDGFNRDRMRKLVTQAVEGHWPYVQFMLHSSELMPGGSRRFRTAGSIQRLYKHLDSLFSLAARTCQAATLSEFASHCLQSPSPALTLTS